MQQNNQEKNLQQVQNEAQPELKQELNPQEEKVNSVEQQPVEQDPAEKAKTLPSDRHLQKDPYKDPVSFNDIKEDEIPGSVFMPTTIASTMEDLIEVINGLDGGEIDQYFTEEEKVALQTGSLGNRYTVRNNVLVDKMNSRIKDFVNSIRFGDKNLNLRPINMSTDSKSLSPTQAVLKFRSLLSVGEVIQVPLWHSGIWVTLKPPTQSDIVNMQIAIASNEIELGRMTNTLIYSNYSIVFDRIIVDFIMKHLASHSVKLKENENILDYISLYDYLPLVLALLSAMHPKGINIVRGCSNTTILDSNKKPLCDFVVSAQADPKKLLWVDRSMLSQTMLSHMSNRMEHSMSTDSVREYQLSIQDMVDKEVTINSETGNKFVVKFSVPSIKFHIDRGEKWVFDIIKKAEDLYVTSDNIEQKNNKVNEIAKATILDIYNSFVKEVILDDGVVIKDEDAINEILGIISSDDTAFEEFYNGVTNYITMSSIAIVATPSYTCPKCGKIQNEGKQGSFKEFIPLNIVEHFFGLCALRTDKTRQRLI